MFTRSRINGSKVIRAMLNGEVVWRGYRYLFDDFTGSSLNAALWDVFGATYGTVVVANSECTITNTNTGNAYNNIGIASKLDFPVGTTIIVRSKQPQGRHASVIGFGAAPYTAYPHNNTIIGLGATRYSRADEPTSVALSIRDENNATQTQDGVGETEDSRTYAEYKMIRVSESVVEIYRNDVLEATCAVSTLLAADYRVFFAADAWSSINQAVNTVIVIDRIEVIGPVE